MLHSLEAMRFVGALVLCAVLAACRGDDDAPLRRADGQLFSSAAGEVKLADGGQLEFGITSERYKQWDVAKRGLDRRVAARFGSLLQPHSPTERSIDRATKYLQNEPGARSAIEAAGMSVRDFVLMTVALDQEMRAAVARGEVPEQPTPMPPGYPYPVDSSYMVPPIVTPTPTPTYTPVLPPPRIDSAPRPDTLFVSPAVPPRRDTIVRPADTLPSRVDTLSSPRPSRDSTVRPARDSVVRPARDTVRDTTRRIPPDTLSPR